MKTSFKSVRPAPEYLSELRPGESGIVIEVDSNCPIGRRLLDLGLLPHTPVRALRKAPLGDPAVFEFRGYRLCLRETEAAQIRIKSDPSLPRP